MTGAGAAVRTVGGRTTTGGGLEAGGFDAITFGRPLAEEAREVGREVDEVTFGLLDWPSGPLDVADAGR